MTHSPADVTTAIDDALSSPDLSELGKDSLETVIDSLMKDGAAKDFPVVANVFRAVDVVGRVREGFLKRKLLVFLVDVSRVTASERKAAMAQLFAGDKERRKFTDLILHLVDELRSEERVRMIASLFVALLTGGITERQFRRLCDLVRNVQHEHLNLLRRLSEQQPVLVPDEEAPFITFYALALPDYQPHADGYGVRYRRTPLGTAFVEAVGPLQVD